jgi:hypothetical protein
MNIKTFVSVISKLPANISVLAKGPTGIGKSHIVHQVGKRLNMEVIDRRLSQMTEGDIIGLPELTDGITRFAPVDWFVKACNEPCILFFDELNRATIEVQQCAFQIVLDRELNGHKLHPETRVYAAVNEGSEYQVTEMDPALLRRFFVTTLEPSLNDWLTWAEKTGIDWLIRDFIKKYPAHLRHTGELQPGKVYPNPASWHRLNDSLAYASIAPSDIINAGNIPEILLPMCEGFVGEITSLAFVDFVKNYEYKFSAKDVLDNDKWKNKKEKILNLSNDKKNDLLEQIVNHTKDTDITVEQALNASEFAKTCSDEMLVNFMNGIMSTGNIPNIRKIHKFIAKRVVDIVNEAQSLK